MIMFAVISSLNSYSILDRINGNAVNNLDARTLSMGSASVVGGKNLFDTLINPANLSNLESKFGFALSGKYLMNTDNRSLPMYNSFDGYSGDGTYVSNVNIFADYAFGAFYQKTLSVIDLGVAVLHHPFVNFDSDYFEQVRNNQNSDDNSYPPIIAKNFILGSGEIQATSFVMSIKVYELASFGFQFSKLTGDSELENKIIWSDEALNIIPTLENTINYSDRNFEAFSTQFGADIQILNRISMGFSYSPKIEFDVTGSIFNGVDTLGVDSTVFVYTKYDTLGIPTDSLTFADYTIPTKFRVGLNYQPRNIMRTNFNLDLEIVKWSDANPLFDDVINYYLGVEHYLKHSIPIRVGFNYTTEFCLSEHESFTFASKLVSPSFSVGTGFEMLDKFTLNFGIELTNRQYEMLDLFMDSFYDYDELWANPQYLNFEDRGWENPDTVNETFLNLQTSIIYKW